MGRGHAWLACVHVLLALGRAHERERDPWLGVGRMEPGCGLGPGFGLRSGLVRLRLRLWSGSGLVVVVGLGLEHDGGCCVVSRTTHELRG